MILPALFERFGERGEAPGTPDVLRDEGAGGRLRASEIPQPPLRLRQQEQRARVVGTRRQHLGEHVTRCADRLASAAVQQRRRVPPLQVGVARRSLDRLGKRAGGVLPPPVALEEIGQRGIQPRVGFDCLLEPLDRVGIPSRARIGFDEQLGPFLPTRLLVDELGQKRNRLIVRPSSDVKPPQRGARGCIRLADQTIERLFEMLDSFRHVFIGPAARRPGRVWTPVLGQRGIDQPKDAVRFVIGRRDLQRLLARRDGLVETVLLHVERRQLGDDIGRLRVELDRALEGRDRSVDVLCVFEMAREKKLTVRLGDLIGRGGHRLSTTRFHRVGTR